MAISNPHYSANVHASLPCILLGHEQPYEWATSATRPTYTASDVGAVPTSRTVNGKALSANISLNASDTGAVPTTRTVNGKALSTNISLNATDVSAVPTTRTVAGKALSANITLNASDVGAVPTSRTINSKALTSNISLNASDVGAVPTSRTINGNYLSTNITLQYYDVGAAPLINAPISSCGVTGSVHFVQNHIGGCNSDNQINGITFAPNEQVSQLSCVPYIRGVVNTSLGNLREGETIEISAPNVHILTGSFKVNDKEVTGGGTTGSYVPTTRTINGKSLSSNITLTATDVNAVPALPTKLQFSNSVSITAGSVNSKGGLIIDGSLNIKPGNSGGIINFGDGDYVHIYEKTDDYLEIKAKSVDFVTTQSPYLKLNGSALIQASTSDLTANTSTLTTGTIYCVYE